ncbi:MAG: PASTA domain-containing protein, partial [Microbacterium sp.]|nr:PASTA domain-containing protein [Microbacterium sp.]
DFVSWYDGHPDVSRTWPLHAREVAVLGAGNVALDVSRMLAKHAKDLLPTDVPANVYEILAANPVTDVHVFARRGPAQVKFSPLELRELGHVPDVDVIVYPEDFDFDAGSMAAIHSSNQTKQVVNTLTDWTLKEPEDRHASRRIHLHFLHKPVAVLGDGGHVVGLRTERMTLTDALATSPNTAFVKLEEFTGLPDVVDMSVRVGMKSLATTPFIDPNTRRKTDRSIAEVTKAQKLASFTLGVTPTSVLELANVGATLYSSGKWCPPSPIESVTDAAGKVVPVTEAACEQAVEPELANTLVNALSKDDLMGTSAAAARQVGWNRPMLGKTGTTQQHKSAAFVGAVPQLSGAVITFDNSNAPKPLCDGAGAPFACRSGNIFGGKTPAETWFGAVTPILEGQPVLPLPPTADRYLTGGAETRVPDVVGRGQNDATAILQRANWRVSARVVDNNAPRGTVVGQSPRGTALPGETIVLQVSSGTVPEAPPAPGDTTTEPPAPPGDGGGGGGGPGGQPGG